MGYKIKIDQFNYYAESMYMKTFLAATMFAHFQQETSGLYYLEEIAKSDYCATWSQWVKKAYPCTPGNLNIKI